jgi:hypothetical protein
MRHPAKTFTIVTALLAALGAMPVATADALSSGHHDRTSFTPLPDPVDVPSAVAHGFGAVNLRAEHIGVENKLRAMSYTGATDAYTPYVGHR